jgi:hypothetical protein
MKMSATVEPIIDHNKSIAKNGAKRFILPTRRDGDDDGDISFRRLFNFLKLKSVFGNVDGEKTFVFGPIV